MSNHTPKVIGAPDVIWLNYGDLPEDTQHSDFGEVTWCDMAHDASDVKYVRADMVMASLDALKEILMIAKAASHGHNFNNARIKRAEDEIAKAEWVLDD